MSADGLKTRPLGLVDRYTVCISRHGEEGGGFDSRSIVAECCKTVSGVTGAYTVLVS